MTVNFELESGYDWENWIDWPDENVTLQPPDALKSGTFTRGADCCMQFKRASKSFQLQILFQLPGTRMFSCGAQLCGIGYS